MNELEAKADIYNKLDLIKDEHLPRGFGPRLINDMFAMLKMQLSFDEWNEKAHLIELLRDIEHAAKDHV